MRPKLISTICCPPESARITKFPNPLLRIFKPGFGRVYPGGDHINSATGSEREKAYRSKFQLAEALAAGSAGNNALSHYTQFAQKGLSFGAIITSVFFFAAFFRFVGGKGREAVGLSIHSAEKTPFLKS